MSWRDELRPGSFRGASFWTEDADVSGGRRVVVHQYPFRNTPFVEDIGGRAESYNVNAYIAASVRDPNYIPARDALLKALRADGPGELLHPYHGTMTVQCVSFVQGEAKERGGVAYFRLTFVEAGENQNPTGLENKPARMTGLSRSAMGLGKANFLGNYQSRLIPDFVTNSMAAILNEFGASVIGHGERYALNGQNNDIASATAAFLAAIVEALDDEAETADIVIALVTAVAEAFESPCRKYRQFDGTYRAVGKRMANPLPRESVAMLMEMTIYGETLPEVVGTTALRARQRANQTALIELIRHASLIEAARLAPFVDWKTYDVALDARDRLMTALEAAALAAADDGLYQCLSDLRVLVAETVPPESAQLPSLIAYTTNRTTPALRLAYDEYDDAGRFEEIVDMNGIRHPGFIPGAATIRMLSDV